MGMDVSEIQSKDFFIFFVHVGKDDDKRGDVGKTDYKDAVYADRQQARRQWTMKMTRETIGMRAYTRVNEDKFATHPHDLAWRNYTCSLR